MENKRIMVKKLLDCNVDELYITLGNELFGSRAFPVPSEELCRAARTWLKQKRSYIADTICPTKAAALLASKDSRTRGRITLILAIADLISSIVTGVSPITVSVLIFKEGLYLLCKDYWLESMQNIAD